MMYQGEESSKVTLKKEREGFEELLYRAAKSITVTEIVEASRDPDDDKFLALAVAGKAEVIVSGDKDLLVLDPFGSVRVVRPRVFVEEFPPEQKAVSSS
jgi:predicted nucleic acid-binding protein